MTTLAFPLLSRVSPDKLDWSLKSNTVTFQSPLTSSVQTVEFPGARWTASFSLEYLTDDDAAILQAFLVRLRGQAGRFYLHNFARPRPRGAGTEGALVNGSGQSGTNLNTDGWQPSTTVLKAGDYVGINGELKMVVSDVVTNSVGAASITFEPPLRSSPADNSSITVNKPTATFMLTEDSARWITQAPYLTSIQIQCVEVWS